MIDPKDHYFLLDYLEAVKQETNNINFLDTGIDTRSTAAGSHSSNRLFVVPKFSKKYIDPQNPEQDWSDLMDLQTLVDEYKRLFILGDPGMGKTTLVRRLATILSSSKSYSFGQNEKPIIPFPITLRGLNFSKMNSWKGLLQEYFNQEFLTHLTIDWELINGIFQGGQALLLLDGLDEIHSEPIREKLAEMIREGMAESPGCTWWFTSRIVGFNQRTFWGLVSDEENTSEVSFLGQSEIFHQKFLLSLEEESSLFPQLYLAPFGDQQIRYFMKLWFDLHENNRRKKEVAINKFMDSLDSHDRIQHLARIPNLLTMMAIFFRMNQRFPDGRIELFRTIAKAYLDDLNRKRGIELGHQLEFKEQKAGMAAIAYRMQELRSSSHGIEGVQLIISEGEAKQIFEEELDKINRKLESTEITKRVDEFFLSIQKNSAILIPKTIDSYGFLHLSYQEFFAAEALQEEFNFVTGRKGNEALEKEFWDKMQGFAQQSSWHETIVLFFEGFQDDWGGGETWKTVSTPLKRYLIGIKKKERYILRE